jgi:hypothetical protein
MYLVQVDNGLPEVVLLLVEVSHTNLTEVTGMVLFKSEKNMLVIALPCVHHILIKSLEPCPCWYGGGADHRRDHDHQETSCAFRHDHVQRTRDHGACASSWGTLAALFMGAPDEEERSREEEEDIV